MTIASCQSRGLSWPIAGAAVRSINPGRQMPQQIDNSGAGGALDQFRERRPDAGQRRHRREQPVENGGTHRSIYGLPNAGLTLRLSMAISVGPCQPPDTKRTATETPGDIRRKRLLFRSWHRGTREADLILGSFAEAYLAGFDENRLDEYELLLACPDAELFDWIAGRTRAAPRIRHRGHAPAARLPLYPARDVRRRRFIAALGALIGLAACGARAAEGPCRSSGFSALGRRKALHRSLPLSIAG